MIKKFIAWKLRVWRSISLENRKRIVSFLNTFAVTFLLLLATQLESNIPSWEAALAILAAITRSAIREAINELVKKFK